MSPSATTSDAEKQRNLSAGKILAHPEPGEEIVITGIAGSYPDSHNVAHFGENLFNKKDLISEDERRWNLKHPEIPKRGGKLYDIGKFDAAFFGLHYKQAHAMDPMVRMLMEKAFEAIVDAGMHPSELRGTRTGVFVGSCFSEAEKTWFYEKLQPYGYALTGCIRSMLANRISYWLGVDGPSYVVDTACSSSSYALEHAYRAIRTGQCDTAIVGGTNLCLHPYVTLQFARLGVLNSDGNCKCFDKDANGYTRSEAIVAVVLQKSKDARRIYAQVVHTKTNCDGYKEQGITYPSRIIQTNLLREVYQECGVNPLDISYVEAHGTGTRVGDPEELTAIETIFCPPERKSTLMIGSVKSNIGHSEPASGLCSVTKVILAMEAGKLIPNINFKEPRPEIESLNDGRMKVVTDVQDWKGGYVAVSSFGFGGANCHILLKSNTKEKVNQGLPNDDLPRLVYVSGRTEEAIHSILDDVASRPLDTEYIGLLHEVFKYDIPAHHYRGFAVFTKNGVLSREFEYYANEKPLWFVFSGLGSQWLGIATSLMQIPAFAGIIQKCHQILSPKGINITDLITQQDASVFAKQTNIFVTTTSIQIALVELFKYIDLKPAGVIGYSLGEIACAYFDGCLTLEQALLCSYYLGQAADHCRNASGVMVSVNAALTKVQDLLVPGVELAAVNSERNCVVSGPRNKIDEFIQKLTKQNISYDELNVNVAYHSSHVKEIASSVLKHLKPIITKPANRSEKWVSSVQTEDNSCSAEFLSSILVRPVNFEENYRIVPNNAVTLEVSPHGVLQNVLKRSIYDESIHIAALDRNVNSLNYLITVIGRLYKAGFNPRIERIYPKISFPVSRNTPMINSLIKWDHTQDWFVTKFEVLDKIKSGERNLYVKLAEDETQYIAGHCIDGRILYPATGYLTLIWETIGMVRGQVYTEVPVVFENVKFHRATNVPKEGRILLVVMVQRVSGNFEIIEGGTAIVTGRIYVPDDISTEVKDFPIPIPEKKDYYVPLQSKDIYKELRLRGYNYSGLFRGLQSCDTTATVGQISWKDNWVAFMDTVLQLQILQVDTRGLFVPTSIEKLVIDVQKQKEIIESLPENGTIPAYAYRQFKTICCGGVQIRGLDASAIARKKILGEPVLETYKFIPDALENSNLSLAQSTRILLHIVVGCFTTTQKFKTSEFLEEAEPDISNLLSPIIINSLADLPLKQPDANILTANTLEVSGVTVSDKRLIAETNCHLVIASNLLSRPQVVQAASNAILKGGYILARESLNLDLSETDLSKFNIIADHKLQSERLILLKKKTDTKIKTFIDVTDKENKFEWLPVLQNAVKTDPNLCVYSHDDLSGIIGFANCLRNEPGTENISYVFIMDEDAPAFDPNNEFYARQLEKQIPFNVFKNGVWGGYQHLLLDEMKNVDVEHAYLNVTVRGDLSSLRWLQGPLSFDAEFDCNKLLANVYYSALNFRDIMTSTGRIAPEVVAKGRFEQECVQGLEFSGRLQNGRRVIGMVPHMAHATLVAADPMLIWDVPDKWSLEEAATVPVVYGTVLYAFVHQGKMKPGMSVLIHSGTGGVGQAAINIALFYGCTVYVTVGSQEKRDFIKKNWPQIKDNQIGNSRDLSFEQMIMTETNGRGVDLALNSLAEEKLLATVRCLARGGKFLEIGKFDLSRDNPLPLSAFENEISFHGVMLDTFFYTANSFKKVVNELVKQHIDNDAVKPIFRQIFTTEEAEETFRYMATGKHMGKILIKVREEEQERVAEPSRRLVKAVPRYYANPNYSYILAGGLGGFGLELVDWLVLRGAKKLVITSRRGISTGYQAMRIKIWRSYGVDVIVSTADITTYEGCQTVIEEATELGPVAGIFNLAVVLRDAIISNQTIEDFITSFGAKAIATRHFDELSRELCPNLSQFVVFSSVSCGRGNAGQSNYGMSNSVMERICERRKQDGFPALAVQWGAVGDVGLVADMMDNDTELVIGGTLQQRISSCLSVLDQFLCSTETICASMLVAEKRGGDGGASNIVEAVLNILGIRDIKTVSIHSSLAELGMDSIMAVEIKQTLEREFEVFLTPQDIRSMTFARLQEIESERETKPTNQDAEPLLEESLDLAAMGMHFIVKAVGQEENASKAVVVLPSKATPATKQRVLLIPGIEGIATPLETLASHLDAHAIVLQLGFKDLALTVEGMAEQLLERALENLPDLHTEGFVIMGYSFGSTIALELASMLEARGAVGKLILVDGSPAMCKLMALRLMDSDKEEEFENKLLALMINLVIPAETAKQLQSVYAECTDWGSKLDTLMKYCPQSDAYSIPHFRSICDAAYIRTKAAISYKPNMGKLKSSFKLIKPTLASLVMDTEDFGLSEFSSQPVEVVYVEGNHVMIVENPECPQQVNNLLHGQVVEKESVITNIDIIKEDALKI